MNVDTVCFFPIVRYQAKLFYSMAEAWLSTGYIKKAIFICPSISSYDYLKKKGIITTVFLPDLFVENSMNNDMRRDTNTEMNVVHFEMKKNEILGKWSRKQFVQPNQLLFESRVYKHVWEKFLTTYRIDILMIWNGYILPQRALLQFEEIKRNTKVLYFENSYEPSSFVMDSKGVNAKSSFENSKKTSRRNSLEYSEVHEKEGVTPAVTKLTAYINTRVRYALKRSSSRYKYILRYEHSQPIIRKIEKICEALFYKQPELPQEFFFFPLQVITDSQLIDNFNKEQESVIAKCLEIIQLVNEGRNKPIYLIIKEHPRQEINGYLKCLREEYSSPYILFVNSGDTSALLEQAMAVITINSSVGYQALKMRKNVFVLGESLYTGDGLAKKVRDWEHLERVIRMLLEGHTFIDFIKIEQFIHNYKEYSYSIDVTNNTLKKIWHDMNQIIYGGQ
ncbi:MULTISPECIES: capsular polysaccharide export protein, LipB/KpsS family [Paenibacillus]|uniref:Capsular biosynthesis protein n=1 Tax=Paenibacillus lautus TaxID=1401 RepID=A0A1R1ALM3_PAELA|nr:hypothetical protein [Paenibacillus lautus]OME86475.1 hypothetical protein BK123_32705 [Paenibacillus lautus]